MAVNPEIVGRSCEPTEPYVVGREKVREFARAVMATHAIHHDFEAARAAGYSDVVAPSTFPVVIQEKTLAQLLAMPDANIDFSRVVHGSQEFAYTRPVVAGDEITAVLTVESVKTLAGNSIVSAVSVMTDAAGDHVVTATSSLVVRAED